MSLARTAGLAAAAALAALPLPALQSDPLYEPVATLPSIVDGQPLRAFAYDPIAERLYAGSDRGLFFADLTEAAPTIKGPLVRRDIRRIDVAPGLGRVFYFSDAEIGYVDVPGGGDAVRLAGPSAAMDLAYEPSRQEVYVAAWSPHVLVFDARSGEARAPIPLPGWRAQALEAVHGRVFFTLADKSGLYVIDAETHAVAPWPVTGRVITPGDLEAALDGRHLFVRYSRDVVAIDITTATVVGRLVSPRQPDIAFDPGTGLLVVTNATEMPLRIRLFRVDEGGLQEVGRLDNPGTGGVGLLATRNGFIQAAYNSLIVWKAKG